VADSDYEQVLKRLMEQSAVKENAAARKRWGVSGGLPSKATKESTTIKIEKPDNSKRIKALQRQVDRLLKEIEMLK